MGSVVICRKAGEPTTPNPETMQHLSHKTIEGNCSNSIHHIYNRDIVVKNYNFCSNSNIVRFQDHLFKENVCPVARLLPEICSGYLILLLVAPLVYQDI